MNYRNPIMEFFHDKEHDFFDVNCVCDGCLREEYQRLHREQLARSPFYLERNKVAG